jgi:fructose-bisphosphate aldolase class II
MDYKEYFSQPRKPLPGDVMFDALYPPQEIILAANTRMTKQVIEGILQAAKDTGNVVIMELALSEMDLNGGYCGVTPATYAQRVREAAEKVGWFGYVLHADHMTVKKGTDEEIEKVKKELDARVEAGFSGYAIDSSFLFDRTKTNAQEQLENIIRVSILLFKYLEGKGMSHYGKEGEVGEIGIKEFTEIAEATHYVDTLKANGIDLNWLAIANGSKHGVTVNAEGVVIPQLSINIQRTVEIADELSKKYRTRIVQHGTTGTPRELVAEHFPKGKISKCNVGTFWMLIVWDILKIFEPELYKKMFDWTIKNYKKDDTPDQEVFAKDGKRATKQFFDEIENVSEETKNTIKARAYVEALVWFKAFDANRTAKKVYDYIAKNNIEY